SLLHTRRQDGLLRGRLRDRYVAVHGGSSLDLWRITTHAPNRNGRGGGTAVLQSPTSYGTTSASAQDRAPEYRSAACPHRTSSRTPARTARDARFRWRKEPRDGSPPA